MKTLLAAATLAATTLAATAGTLQISVTDRDGKPAADVVVLVGASAKLSSAPVTATITQDSLKFVPFLTVVPVGSTLRFVNRDQYDHHVRSTPSGPLGSMPPAQSFELRLDAGTPAPSAAVDDYAARPAARKPPSGTSSIDVKIEQAGPIGLGCHIHASMRGQVYVSPTPWFGKTDANGSARIDNVPEGAMELTLWHPDQLQDQPLQRLQLGAAPLVVTSQLNFVPRRRRN